MSAAATNSFSSELIQQQNAINLLLSQLDEKVTFRQNSDDLKDSVTDLIEQISGNHNGIHGDLMSLLSSFKNGLITGDELERMIMQERVRSNFLMNESMGMSKQMKFMFSQFEKLIESIDATDPTASNGIDNMNSNMHYLMEAIDVLAEVVASPGNEIHSLVASVPKLVPKSFDDSPRMQNPKRFKGSNKSAVVVESKTIESSVAPQVHRRLLGSGPKPGIIIKAVDYPILDQLPARLIVRRNDSASQTTLSTVDFLDTLARMLTTPPMELPSPALSNSLNYARNDTSKNEYYGDLSSHSEEDRQLKKKEPLKQKKIEKVETGSKSRKSPSNQKVTLSSSASSGVAKKIVKETKKDVIQQVNIKSEISSSIDTRNSVKTGNNVHFAPDASTNATSSAILSVAVSAVQPIPLVPESTISPVQLTRLRAKGSHVIMDLPESTNIINMAVSANKSTGRFFFLSNITPHKVQSVDHFN